LHRARVTHFATGFRSDLQRSLPTRRSIAPGLEENIAAADLELTTDELREIEDALPEAHGARDSEANQRMIDR
jgi:hypothetical protein